MQLLAWGNNLTGNLDPKSESEIISSPQPVLEDLDIGEIKWSSWACTIGKGGDDYYIWGCGPSDDESRVQKRLVLSVGPARFLGADEPTAYLDQGGFVHTLPDHNYGSESSKVWRDVVMTGLGSVYAISEKGIYRFDTFEDFMIDSNPTEISHPVLDPKSPISLYATESRVLVLSKGPLSHLFELDYKASVKLIEDLEGLGIEAIIAGSANRFAAITEAGDAYIIHKRSLEPELVEIDDDSAVRCVGVGSKHEVVITEENVWVRGENDFSQLGIEGEAREDFVKLPYFDQDMAKRVKAVHCGRWSTIVVMHK